MPVVKEVVPLAVAVIGAVTGGTLFAASKVREAVECKNWMTVHNRTSALPLRRLEELQLLSVTPLNKSQFASPLKRVGRLWDQ